MNFRAIIHAVFFVHFSRPLCVSVTHAHTFSKSTTTALARKRYEYCNNINARWHTTYAYEILILCWTKMNSESHTHTYTHSAVVSRAYEKEGIRQILQCKSVSVVVFDRMNAKRTKHFTWTPRTCAWLLCWNILIVLLFIVELKLTFGVCVHTLNLFLSFSLSVSLFLTQAKERLCVEVFQATGIQHRFASSWHTTKRQRRM